MKKHNKNNQRSWNKLLLASLFITGTVSVSGVTILQESFETDGSVATGDGRYVVENGSDDGSNDYFARRALGSAGTRVRGTIDGTNIWSIRDLDGDGVVVNDLESDEGRITWATPIDISGLGNFTLSVLAAQGGDEQEGDNVMAFQIKIDDGDWLTIGGFRGIFTNSPSTYFEGDLRTLAKFGDPRLTGTFKPWSWDVYATGSTMQIRMYTNMNGGSEENHFDNLKIEAVDNLEFFTMTLNKTTFVETEGTAAGELTFTISNAAPTGGVTFSIDSTDADQSESFIPETFTIPEGQTSAILSFDIVADNRYDGSELVRLYVSADGYARDQITFDVTNVDSKPNVVINEFLPFLNGVNEADLSFDVSGDGFVREDDDNFIEIVNLESFAVDISGWNIQDELAIRHIFPEGTVLGAGEGILVFSGGNPTGVFGGVEVQTASYLTLNFDEDGDIAQLFAGTALVDSFAYGSDIGLTLDAIARNPDFTGNFVDYSAIDGSGTTLWSPGTKLDGTPFVSTYGDISLSLSSSSVVEGNKVNATITLSAPAPSGGQEITIYVSEYNQISFQDGIVIPAGQSSTVVELEAIADYKLDGTRELKLDAMGSGLLPDFKFLTVEDAEADNYSLVINEVMGDIIETNSDLNKNGIVEELVEDQFIEIVNTGSASVDLTDWSIESWRTSKAGGAQLVHVFPNPTILSAGGSIVIFGGGDESTLQGLSAQEFGGAIVQVANSHGNGVNVTNGGQDGRVTLYGPFGHTEDDVVFDGNLSEQGQAIVRDPELTGNFGALHLEVSTAFEIASPGRQLDGNAFLGNSFDANSVSARGFFVSGIEYNNGWWFLPELGWVLTTADWFPIVYLASYNGWVSIVAVNSTEESFFLYDFKSDQWGETGTSLFPFYRTLTEPSVNVDLMP